MIDKIELHGLMCLAWSDNKLAMATSPDSRKSANCKLLCMNKLAVFSYMTNE